MSNLAKIRTVLLFKAGDSARKISHDTGISLRTVRRWLDEEDLLPLTQEVEDRLHYISDVYQKNRCDKKTTCAELGIKVRALEQALVRTKRLTPKLIPQPVVPDAPKPIEIIDTPSGEYDDDYEEIGDTPPFLEDHTKICVDAYKRMKSFPAAVEFLASRGIKVTQKSLSKAVSQYATQALLSEVESIREKDFSPSRRVYGDDDNADILLISDLHAPYTHPDALAFLARIKEVYEPRRIIGMGDELDFYAMSFHASDPDLMSAGAELKAARSIIHPLERMFPDMELCSSNHGSMAFRRAKEHGIPKHLIVPYRDALFADHTPTGLYRPESRGNGWWWEDEILIDLPNTGYCSFVHSLGANVRNASKDSMCNIVQGLHHSTFDIQYTGSRSQGNRFGMTVGCLIDDKALAYAYNKLQAKRPVIGVGYLRDGLPRLIPMDLDRHGRWTGKVRL